MTDKQHIKEEGSAHKYYAQITHLAQDDLDVYEFRLFCHYKRWASADDSGACWESTRTTAEKCKMSVGKVSETRKSLAEKGFIILTENPATNTLLVTLPDLWPRTIERYGGSSGEHPQPDEQERSPHEHERSSGEQGVHVMNGERSPHEPIKNQLEEESKEEETVIQESSSSIPTSTEQPDTTPTPPDDDDLNELISQFRKSFGRNENADIVAFLRQAKTDYGKDAMLTVITNSERYTVSDPLAWLRKCVVNLASAPAERPGTTVPGSSMTLAQQERYYENKEYARGGQIDHALKLKAQYAAQFKSVEEGAGV